MGCHVALVKIAQTSLERDVNHDLVLGSRTGVQRDELMLAPPISLSGRSLDVGFASSVGC